MDVFAEEAFIPPSNLQVKTWRYMSLDKFVSMLQHSALFFARLDIVQWEDAHEGSIPAAEYAARCSSQTPRLNLTG